MDSKFVSAWIVLLIISFSLTGCYSTRWEKFDEQMKSEVGVKNRDYYIVEWGPPNKRTALDDGGEVLTWEWHGYAADQYKDIRRAGRKHSFLAKMGC
jgi:hypothetical protein